MKKFLLFAFIMLLSTFFYAQTVTLTFTGSENAYNQHIQLDRVVISNLTRNWQETIFWPDTVLTMQVGTGIDDIAGAMDYSSIQLLQNNPNPFTSTTEVSIMAANEGTVSVDIADINGRIIAANEYSQQPGILQFRVTLATAGTYVMTARQNGHTSSIKMVCNGGTEVNKIEYTGSAEMRDLAFSKSPELHNAPKYTTTNSFALGDQMEYVGYATIDGMEFESIHATWVQTESQDITLYFDFSLNQPCPGAATVTDIDNNTYNTVRIGDQCWMKENLRTTRYADGTTIALGSSTSTTTKYRYYPNNDESNVATYGYLYNWNAVMGASSSSSANPSGVQGICPDGWHVPSNAEFHQLKYFVSSRSQYVCGDDNTYIAKALASVEGWNSSSEQCAVGNNSSTNNMTGFSALPAGIRFASASFFGEFARFWSSTKMPENSSLAFYMQLSYDKAFVLDDEWMYGGNAIVSGHSVRCVRN